MFCMKCVLCINISRPESKLYEYITYWLISSGIANCFELTTTLTYQNLGMYLWSIDQKYDVWKKYNFGEGEIQLNFGTLDFRDLLHYLKLLLWSRVKFDVIYQKYHNKTFQSRYRWGLWSGGYWQTSHFGNISPETEIWHHVLYHQHTIIRTSLSTTPSPNCCLHQPIHYQTQQPTLPWTHFQPTTTLTHLAWSIDALRCSNFDLRS